MAHHSGLSQLQLERYRTEQCLERFAASAALFGERGLKLHRHIKK